MADTLILEAEHAAWEAWAISARLAYRDDRHGLCFYNASSKPASWEAWQARAAAQAAAPADAPKRLSEHEVRMIALDHITSGSVGERYKFDAQGLDAFAIDIMNRCRASSVPAIPGTGREKEWTETSKRKPEPGQWCIINIRTHYVNAPARDSVSAARYDGYNWCADGHHLYEPTHWMPFPAAPTPPSEAKAGEPKQ